MFTTFTLVGSALISALFAGGFVCGVGPARGHAGCLAVGIETGIVAIVPNQWAELPTFFRAGSQSADKSVHGRNASSPKDETETRLRVRGVT